MSVKLGVLCVYYVLFRRSIYINMVTYKLINVLLIFGICRIEAEYSTTRMETMCGRLLRVMSYSDHQAEVWFSYDHSEPNAADCNLTLSSGFYQNKFMFFLTDIRLYGSPCQASSVEIYEQRSNGNIELTKNVPMPLCTNTVPWTSLPSPVYATSTNFLKLRFIGGDTTPPNAGFRLIYTTFRTNTECNKVEYECGNGRCIDSEFKCRYEDIDSCGDNSGCDTPGAGLTVAETAGLCLGIGVAFFGIVIVCIIIARRTRDRRQRHLANTSSYAAHFNHAHQQSSEGLPPPYEAIFVVSSDAAIASDDAEPPPPYKEYADDNPPDFPVTSSEIPES